MITQVKISSKTGAEVAARCISAVSVRTAVSVILSTLIHVCVTNYNVISYTVHPGLKNPGFWRRFLGFRFLNVFLLDFVYKEDMT